MSNYKIKNSTKTFTLVGTTTKGQAILEEVLHGRIITQSFSRITKVVPYTVDVRKLGYRSVTSYFAKEGSLEVGDKIIVGETLCVVQGINTENPKARMPISGEKVTTTPIESI